MSILDKIDLKNKLNFDDWYNTFLGLDRQQQILVSIGLGIALIILLSLPISCVSSKLGEKESEYRNYEEMVSEFYGIQNEYTQLRTSFEQLRRQSQTLGTDSLKTILYNVTDELGIDRRKVTPKTMNPVAGDIFTEMIKDVTIKNIRFDQCIKLLGKLVENPDIPITIKKVDIKADKQNKQMINTMTFTMATLKLNN